MGPGYVAMSILYRDLKRTPRRIMGNIKEKILGNHCKFGTIFRVNILKRIAGKLRRIILLDFGLSIVLWENPKTSIFMISGFLRPVGTLIYGFEYNRIPNTYHIQSKNTSINRLLMVSG